MSGERIWVFLQATVYASTPSSLDPMEDYSTVLWVRLCLSTFDYHYKLVTKHDILLRYNSLPCGT